EVADRLNDIDEIDGVELNISCPNVKAGGIVFGTDPQAASEVVSLVRSRLTKPLIVKLTPNVTDITVIARAVEDAGADA
ncbi:MAG: dihydroorotate dehydrogenase, partial [Desulfuromonadales bacterium]|nr:dihydroorotate dehydrogenase [Desulfuromonadales bacterium]NIS41045.1 dihydroorotate dehydrogenase [Desulfuromonadales bacterium]